MEMGPVTLFITMFENEMFSKREPRAAAHFDRAARRLR